MRKFITIISSGWLTTLCLAMMAMAYWYERKTPVVIARLFNTVGPRQVGRYGMVVPRFVKQALSNEPITVYGDGEQIRTFTYVDDTVRSLIKLANSEDVLGKIFNVGSNESISIIGLAKKIKLLAGSHSPIQHLTYEEAYGAGFEDMLYRVPDIAKIKKAVNYSPRVKLDEMLKRIIDFHKQK